MEHLVSSIGENKVTLKILSNEFEERYEYDVRENMFDKIEDMCALFKQIKNHRPAETKTDDPFLYAVLFYKDPTISLYRCAQKNEQIKSYLDLVTKEIPLNIKELGFTKRRITKEMILEEKPHFYEYVCRLVGVSAVVDGRIYGAEEHCLLVSESGDPQSTQRSAWLDKSYKEKAERYSKENLNTCLVSELKKIADELGVSTSTTEGKKRPLLKAELLSALNDKISIILSKDRENGDKPAIL